MVKKGRWDTMEDFKLCEYVITHGPKNWKVVADYVGNRNSKQCRERWDGHLKNGVNKRPFTPEEESMIIKLFEEDQYRWRDIAKYIGNGRTANSIKNIYKQKLSKRLHKPFKMQKNIKGYNNNAKLKTTIKESSNIKMEIRFIINYE